MTFEEWRRYLRVTRFNTIARSGPCRSSQTLISLPASSPDTASVWSLSFALNVKVFCYTLPSDSGELCPSRVNVPVKVAPLGRKVKEERGTGVGHPLPFSAEGVLRRECDREHQHHRGQ